MAQVRQNPLLVGLSGSFGKTIVFRQVRGKTIMANVSKRDTSKDSDEQRDVRERFRAASKYAKAVTALPKMKKLYEDARGTKFISAHAVALCDFLKSPVIHQVDIERYAGKPGDFITVEATDDFCVAYLGVMIVDGNGNEIEKGEAVRGIRNEWVYAAKATNENLEGSVVKVVAKDLPGNTTAQTKLVQDR